MSQWEKVKLKDFYSFTSGLSKESEFFGSGFDFLSFKDVFDNYFIPPLLQTKVKSTIAEREKLSIKKGDVFLTRTSETEDELGMSSVALKDYPNATFNGFTKRLRPNENGQKYILPEFIGYYLRTRDFRATITSLASSTTRASLNNSMLETLEIPLPPLPEQKAIAGVLSSLDDKIDLLYRQNKTLEAMAETLFRQWFIEEANNDWKEGSLSSIAEFLNGIACQKFPPQNDADKLPVLKIKELRNGFSSNCDYASTNVDTSYIVKKGDIIFSWSASLMVKIWDGETCILNQHLFKVYSNEYPKWFIYFWCKQHLEEFIAISASHATTMGHIKRKDLDDAKVLIPTKAQLSDMTNIINPLMSKIFVNNEQIEVLRKQRDILLLKLMNGEISVR